MSKVLYVKASPRGERSFSIGVADAFLDEYRQRHPDDVVEEIDLFSAGLPAFGALEAEGKYSIIYGKEGSPEAKEAWRRVETVIEAFKSADRYVFSVPMWNFGIPYVLKHYIDVITQPTYTFAVGPTGYEGLVKGKRAFVAFARGGTYSEASGAKSMDHQKPYFEQALGFMGITDVHSVVVEGTLGGPDSAQAILEEAKGRARDLARDF